MQITHFKINQLRTAINLTVEDAASLTSLSLWTNKTYKDFNKTIDLSSKLTGALVEDIVISLSDINESYFDGVYFIEAEDTDEISQAITADLTRYKECIVNKLSEYSVCEDCFTKVSVELQNSHALLMGLEDAVEAGFIDETFNLVSALDKYCSNECSSCGKYSNTMDNSYYNIPENTSNLVVEKLPFILNFTSVAREGELFKLFEDDKEVYSQEITTLNTSGASKPIVMLDITKTITAEYNASGSNVYTQDVVTYNYYNLINGLNFSTDNPNNINLEGFGPNIYYVMFGNTENTCIITITNAV